ncbi:hypothetical protein ASD48_08155 [Streptomyces sp. Root1310]|nr:hypothetical protein ASD48_08155 [Streptomyces sp. Root1310]
MDDFCDYLLLIFTGQVETIVPVHWINQVDLVYSEYNLFMMIGQQLQITLIERNGTLACSHHP